MYCITVGAVKPKPCAGPGSVTSVMMTKVMKPVVMLRDKQKTCSSRCLDKVALDVIHSYRYKYWIRSPLDRKVWLTDVIEESQRQKRTRLFRIHGCMICQQCFMRLLHLSKEAFFGAVKLCKSSSIAPGIQRQHTPRSKAFIQAIQWLEGYVEYHADRMPHLPDLYLPYKTVKSDVFKGYASEHANGISQSTFLLMWRKYFRHVKIKQVSAWIY